MDNAIRIASVLRSATEKRISWGSPPLEPQIAVALDHHLQPLVDEFDLVDPWLLIIGRRDEVVEGLRVDGIIYRVKLVGFSVLDGGDGLADGGPSVARFESREAGVKRWVGKTRSYWGWVHPRYR